MGNNDTAQVISTLYSLLSFLNSFIIVRMAWPGLSNLWPMGRMWPRVAMNAAQHNIVNLLKTL